MCKQNQGEELWGLVVLITVSTVLLQILESVIDKDSFAQNGLGVFQPLEFLAGHFHQFSLLLFVSVLGVRQHTGPRLSEMEGFCQHNSLDIKRCSSLCLLRVRMNCWIFVCCCNFSTMCLAGCEGNCVLWTELTTVRERNMSVLSRHGRHCLTTSHYNQEPGARSQGKEKEKGKTNVKITKYSLFPNLDPFNPR